MLVLVLALLTMFGVWQLPDSWQVVPTAAPPPAVLPATTSSTPTVDAAEVLAQLAVKGRAPKTGYERSAFGAGWGQMGTCDSRNAVLARDLQAATTDDRCRVLSGTLNDPYTGTTMVFQRGPETSDDVQIDHVVALSNAWQTGAQYASLATRISLANDPLNLLAVNGEANNQKGDGDAATWLPPNKAFRCQYVARQIAVKKKYELWVTAAEKAAMETVLATCPGQHVPQNSLANPSEPVL